MILEFIPLSINEDISRFVNIYDQLILQKIIKKTKKFSITKNKIKKLYEDNLEEVQQHQSKLLDELTHQIIAKKTNRNNYFNSLSNFYFLILENKYAKGEEDNGDIDHEEFEKIQRNIFKNKKK